MAPHENRALNDFLLLVDSIKPEELAQTFYVNLQG